MKKLKQSLIAFAASLPLVLSGCATGTNSGNGFRALEIPVDSSGQGYVPGTYSAQQNTMAQCLIAVDQVIEEPKVTLTNSATKVAGMSDRAKIWICEENNNGWEARVTIP